jgi:hypothetical protein
MMRPEVFMTERASYWSALVKAWEESGSSQASFCRERGVQVGTFAWWKRQLRRAQGDGAKRRGRPVKGTGRFVEVRLAGACSVPTYEVVLAHGRSIRVPSQFDLQTLSRLIAAVESC